MSSADQRLEHTMRHGGGGSAPPKMLGATGDDRGLTPRDQRAELKQLRQCGLGYGSCVLLHLVWVEVKNELATLPTEGFFTFCVSVGPTDTIAFIKEVRDTLAGSFVSRCTQQ